MNFNSLRKEITSNNASVKELVNDIFAKIEHKDPEINSYICTTKDKAIAQAENIDKLIQNKEKLPPLAGMPIAIKDNICIKGVATTCASKMLKNFVAPYESTASSKLWSSGGICLGKTNLDEFAMGSSTETSVFGVTSNPWDTNRVPGGSSGGSAASVAAGFCAAAIGSDTGGSIRQPASFCGVVGLKPTYGRVSRWGLVAFASSLDQIGPITNTVSDAAEILYSISGKDPFDSTCLDKPVPNYLTDLNKSIKGLKIGIIKLPSISNFSDFDPLENEESIEIEWVIKSQSLNQFDFVILPGSKQTIKDQLFLENSGLSDDIREYSNKGNIIGICGGLQMLGTVLEDPFLKEGSKTNLEKKIRGIGLLPLKTTFLAQKLTRQTYSKSIWPCSSEIKGFEIHNGITELDKSQKSLKIMPIFKDAELGWYRENEGGGTIAGTYLHGIFENDEWRAQYINLIRREENCRKWIKKQYLIKSRENQLLIILRMNLTNI